MVPGRQLRPGARRAHRRYDLPVTGAIPPALSGQYLRNGSNPASGTAGHWFFGDGMVHGIRLEGGRASWYRNRWVRTTKLEQAARRDRPRDDDGPDGQRGEHPRRSPTPVASGRWRRGTSRTSCRPSWRRSAATTSAGASTTAFTAHPKLCPETGELHFFGYGVLPPYLTYHVLDASGRARPLGADHRAAKPTMMHDFMITRDHAIFMDLPVCSTSRRRSAGGAPLGWDDNYGARIGILPRLGTDADVRWFDVDPCYVFHPMNAYVDGSQVVCDVGRHEYDVAGLDGRLRAVATCTAGRSTSRPAAVTESSSSTTCRTPSRASTTGSSGCATATAGRRRRDRARPAGMLTQPGVVVKYDLAGRGSERVRPRPDRPSRRVRVRARVGRQRRGRGLGDGPRLRRRHRRAPTSSSSTPPTRRPNRSPGSTCPRRVPYGFHGSWISDAELTADDLDQSVRTGSRPSQSGGGGDLGVEGEQAFRRLVQLDEVAELGPGVHERELLAAAGAGPAAARASPCSTHHAIAAPAATATMNARWWTPDPGSTSGGVCSWTSSTITSPHWP